MRLLALPGDGIGPEITAATLRVLAAVEARLPLGLAAEEADVGLKALTELGTILPDAVMGRTRDLGGRLGTDDFTTRVREAVGRAARSKTAA